MNRRYQRLALVTTIATSVLFLSRAFIGPYLSDFGGHGGDRTDKSWFEDNPGFVPPAGRVRERKGVQDVLEQEGSGGRGPAQAGRTEDESVALPKLPLPPWTRFQWLIPFGPHTNQPDEQYQPVDPFIMTEFCPPSTQDTAWADSSCSTVAPTEEEDAKGYAQLKCEGKPVRTNPGPLGSKREMYAYACHASTVFMETAHDNSTTALGTRVFHVFLPPKRYPPRDYMYTVRDYTPLQLPILMGLNLSVVAGSAVGVRLGILVIHAYEKPPTSGSEKLKLIRGEDSLRERVRCILGKPSQAKSVLPGLETFFTLVSSSLAAGRLAASLQDGSTDQLPVDDISGIVVFRKAVLGLHPAFFQYDDGHGARHKDQFSEHTNLVLPLYDRTRIFFSSFWNISMPGHPRVTRTSEDTEMLGQTQSVCLMGDFDDMFQAFPSLEGVASFQRLNMTVDDSSNQRDMLLRDLPYCGILILNYTIPEQGPVDFVSRALLTRGLGKTDTKLSFTIVDASPHPNPGLRTLCSLSRTRYASLNTPSLHPSFPRRTTSHLVSLLHLALPTRHVDLRFLAYMPWEQLNNQLIGFRSACAVARELGRTLLLPRVGYRREGGGDGDEKWAFSFDVDDYRWEAWEKYFDLDYEADQGCGTISMENLMGLHYDNPGSLEFGTLMSNPIASATNENQLEQYYGSTLNVRHGGVVTSERLQFLSTDGIKRAFEGPSNEERRVIALGSAFWLHGFGKPQQPYPLEQFQDYMDVKAYAEIIHGMKWRPDLRILAEDLLARMSAVSQNGTSLIVTTHVRRGDYKKKCNAIKELDLRESCYPSFERVGRVVARAVVDHVGRSKVARSDGPVQNVTFTLFVATNKASNRMMDRIMNEIWRALNVSSSQVSSEGITLSRAVTTSNLFEHLCYLSSNESPESNSVTRLKTCRMWRERTLDQVELALLDMELCLLADIFVGNYFSSFSRTIIERRALLGKDSVSF